MTSQTPPKQTKRIPMLKKLVVVSRFRKESARSYILEGRNPAPVLHWRSTGDYCQLIKNVTCHQFASFKFCVAVSLSNFYLIRSDV